ncbi:mechanosensitive ion channel family protein [Crocosphaera sp. XPORK-15E]|uniref:mechanosensitive ion channel family protein n=1 Tax=Crocosphaera sp. XPORK-15E TaxID=3110247 RepID=UPI002B1EDD79|nr:mechanosensitive ion channel family protein [Crocosphaera sp. XPORK-15E]MEA5533564.1 mechanosensitive ion channel family protein [Crocosphaera sp. XPORK-15E]
MKNKQKSANFLKQLIRQKWINIIFIFLATYSTALPVKAQSQIIPFLPDLSDKNSWLLNKSGDINITACVRLDGRCLFNITYPKTKINERIEIIEKRLKRISELYFSQENSELKIEQRGETNPKIYVIIDEQTTQLMTVGNLDIENEGIDADTKASLIVEQLEGGLKQAKQERQLEYLMIQGLISLGIMGGSLIINTLIRHQINRLKFSQEKVAEVRTDQPISMLLTHRQQWNIKEVQYRLLQLAQTVTWLGGSLLILGLFPYTRIAQFWLITLFKIPARLVTVGVGTYVIIRLSYALIAQTTSALMMRELIDFRENQRLELRVTTISLVARSIITVIWTGTGIIIGLSVIGINVTPLLTGLGILGVGVSLASQNLIRDGINGFFIILEDQYAVGDVIQVGSFGGLVENINLRITQLRDSEGRLITIPNSEVKIVANLSSKWSRADLNIPISYDTDLEQALSIIKNVAETMGKDRIWRQDILENPEILGVDNFEERGLMIRVWIKTKPLKQWDVSREFRRRLKVEFDHQGLPLPVPQQKVWFTDDKINGNGQEQPIN